ncbi:MAG TPA: adenylate/guanylate cyclase domain-containing protein [Gaiellaceae bacterium]|nr:adenylate/guanylate cyclase domain-containing protein [Gaiellaceae bacterium]
MTTGAHRKVVTVLFCDVVGSTALGESVDPEALQRLLARYFERMSGIVEAHGGSVEKFIGDAVMAVFGVPAAHEDDALRACRAAVEMRDALPELGVEGRIGLNTGEVLTGTEERLATGDVVNVAARLEQAAEPGEILIGAETLGLVGDAAEVGEERQLELKGKSEPVSAHALLAVREAERSHAFRFVGRDRELEQLADVWYGALAGPSCELITIVGDPGVGKSRLAAEALERIDARVVHGRCLSYGEGITFWPVIEVVKQLHTRPDDEHAALAISSLLGETETLVGTDEIAWAFRKLLEAHAPLVVCFDDIQWGEETFLNLIESTALLCSGTPLLLVCLARPELLDPRPQWPAVSRLEPLPEDEAGALVGDGVADEVREQIVRASAGNPLFLTEMAALADVDGGQVEVPATLWALLAARLDRLDESERIVLEHGAVEGELFHRGTVQALAPAQTEVTPRLASLVRRDLVHPDRPVLPREDAFRFRHLLIRDAAYDALPKATRADLHRRFAGWLQQHGEELVELDEILGYHLEQAARYLDELDQPDPEVALAAGVSLATAGRRALWRGDNATAAGLLERALRLMRPYRLNIHLELDLLAATDEPPKQLAIATAAAERAAAANDERGELVARVVAATAGFEGLEGSSDELERLARRALPVLEEAEDHRSLIAVWSAFMSLATAHLEFERLEHASEQMIHHSRLAGIYPGHIFGLPFALLLGPRPAAEALRRLESLESETQHPVVTLVRADLLAMLGRSEEAESLAESANKRMKELGRGEWTSYHLALRAEIAGNHELAAEQMGFLCDHLEALGQTAALSTFAPWRARFLCALGRYDEAELLAEQGRELGDPDDKATQVMWRQALALVHAHHSRHDDAERLAREAVEIDREGDSLWEQGDTYCALAEVLGVAGRRDEAIAAWQEALGRYERKGIVPLARSVRERLAELQPV